MININLFSVPTPGQSIHGESKFLGTSRNYMHKAPLTALAAGLEERLSNSGVQSKVQIIDLQTRNPQKIKYGEMDLGELIIDKYRVGTAFEESMKDITNSDVLGINANFTHSRNIVRDFITYAKKVNPQAIIVTGGTDATADSSYYLNVGSNVVVRGEGEVTFQKLIEAINNNEGYKNIPNISFNSNEGIKHNNANFLRNPYDLSQMKPHNLGIVNLKDYLDTGEGKPSLGVRAPFISIETSRGCENACSFCATPITKGRYRTLPLESIREHFEYYRGNGIKTLLFQEDNLLSRLHKNGNNSDKHPEGRKELLEIFRYAKEMGFSWEFTNGLEFGQYDFQGAIDEELINTMFWHEKKEDSHVGCYRATIPLENLSETSGKLFSKLKPLGRSKEIIRRLAETNVDMLSFNLIIGRPEEDERILKLSYERCIEIRDLVQDASNGKTQHYFNVYNLSLLPGTLDFKRFKSLLAFDPNIDPEAFTFYIGSIRTPYFSPLEITQARGSLVKSLNSNSMIDNFDENRLITSEKFDKLFS